MAPPNISRYPGGPQGMAQFGHPQQQHLHHQGSQNVGSVGLSQSSLGGHPGFGNSNANLNLFSGSSAVGNNMNNFGGGGFGAAGSGLGGRGGMGGGGTGLASHAAQLGFAHGAALQRQELNNSMGSGSGEGKGMSDGRIRDVWKGNLAQEMAVLRNLVEQYPYISMDSEFPGIVCRPMGGFTSKADYHYQTLRCNVDLLKMIQLGITLFSAEGELPPPHSSDASGVSAPTYQNHLIPCPCTWQFNFKFSLTDDMYAEHSYQLLKSSGIDFTLHEKNGIDPMDFGAALMESGLVLDDDVRWISFHSGYDFGYLMKLMLCKPLPVEESEFCKLLRKFFPNLYDVKYLLNHTLGGQAGSNSPLGPEAMHVLANLTMKSGLSELADEFNVKRSGPHHQAGSDSLVTGKIFWEMCRRIFGGKIEEDRYSGQIWGLNGIGAPASAASTAALTANKQQGLQGHTTPNTNNSHLYHNGAAPTTPNTGHAGLAHTPGPTNNGIGSLTPGGGGGVFGGFQFGKA
ncbi:MAG: hypothetical protein M4579_000285 [Chaenotheca gracillima]|nr:MAG: hypothetical protein M4579_000285 [Chaenotheca gracillima]